MIQQVEYLCLFKYEYKSRCRGMVSGLRVWATYSSIETGQVFRYTKYKLLLFYYAQCIVVLFVVRDSTSTALHRYRQYYRSV